MDLGLKWFRLYSVIDLDQFVNKSLHDNVDPDEFKGMQKPHATTKTMTEPEGLRSLLLPKYRVANLTLEGREEFWNDARPTKDELQEFPIYMGYVCGKTAAENVRRGEVEWDDALPYFPQATTF